MSRPRLINNYYVEPIIAYIQAKNETHFFGPQEKNALGEPTKVENFFSLLGIYIL